jgi:hypothetical protein
MTHHDDSLQRHNSNVYIGSQGLHDNHDHHDFHDHFHDQFQKSQSKHKDNDNDNDDNEDEDDYDDGEGGNDAGGDDDQNDEELDSDEDHGRNIARDPNLGKFGIILLLSSTDTFSEPGFDQSPSDDEHIALATIRAPSHEHRDQIGT